MQFARAVSWHFMLKEAVR